MGKLALIVDLEIAFGRSREELLPILAAHRDRCLKDEPETLAFSIMLPEDRTRVLVFLLFESGSGFEANVVGTSYAQIRAEATGIVRDATILRCDVV